MRLHTIRILCTVIDVYKRQVKARAFNEDGDEYEIEGTELLARAICHELDHLDGHMYMEKVEGELHDVVYEEG